MLRLEIGITSIGLLVLAGCASHAPLSPQAIAAIVASPDRSAADRTNDIRRKPAEMLTFIGVRPGAVALRHRRDISK